MSAILALTLAQSAALPMEANSERPELRAAYECLAKNTQDWLEEYDWLPAEDERWRWARAITARCEDRIGEAARYEGSIHQRLRCNHCDTISYRDALRTEANYMVDRLLRTHFEESGE